MAKQRRKRDGETSGIVFALWGKTPGELDSAEWDRYRRLTRMTSYYRRHERNKAQQRKDKSWRKLEVLDILGWEAACMKCGYDTYIGALDFHHIDPSGKVGNVMACDANTVIEEARKCVLICANCHREAHAEMRAAGDPHAGKGGRPVGEADPMLAEYMRLSGLSEETIAAAHAGRPGEDKQIVLRQDKQIVRERLTDALGDTHRRIELAMHHDDVRAADYIEHIDGRCVPGCVHCPEPGRLTCKTSGTAQCTCPPNGICNDCTVDVALW